MCELHLKWYLSFFVRQSNFHTYKCVLCIYNMCILYNTSFQHSLFVNFLPAFAFIIWLFCIYICIYVFFCSFFFVFRFFQMFSLCRWTINPNQRLTDISLWVISKFHNHLFRHFLFRCNNKKIYCQQFLSAYQRFFFFALHTCRDMQAYIHSFVHSFDSLTQNCQCM